MIGNKLYTYNFLWNDSGICIEFFEGVEDETGQSQLAKAYELRMSREDALKFAKQVSFYSATKIKAPKGEVKLKQDSPDMNMEE